MQSRSSICTARFESQAMGSTIDRISVNDQARENHAFNALSSQKPHDKTRSMRLNCKLRDVGR